VRVLGTKQYRKDAYSAVNTRTTDLSEHFSIVLRANDRFAETFKGVCAWMHPNGTGGFRLKMSAGPQLNLEQFPIEALTALRDQLSHVIEQHEDFPYGSGLFNTISRGDI
jgi:hypothetical protein